jgi:hypothetical protein
LGWCIYGLYESCLTADDVVPRLHGILDYLRIEQSSSHMIDDVLDRERHVGEIRRALSALESAVFETPRTHATGKAIQSFKLRLVARTATRSQRTNPPVHSGGSTGYADSPNNGETSEEPRDDTPADPRDPPVGRASGSDGTIALAPAVLDPVPS